MNPQEDGVTHINIYSKGATALGRWLSNFAAAPFVHPVHGQFASIEGFWYWLGTGNYDLRPMYGFAAKKFGKTLPRIYTHADEDFKRNIREACWAKLWTYPVMAKQLATSTLPFVHYYNFGGKTRDAGYVWLVEMWEQYRIEARKYT